MSTTTRTPGDARTAPVAAFHVIESLRGQDLIDWRVAPLENRLTPAERGLDVGYPFGWYAVELSTFAGPGEVRPLRYFSKDLAMWRGEDGKVRVIDAYCRHMGAHLGHGGKTHGDLLECPFHGWRYDGDEGVVKEIPYAKTIPPQVKRKCVRTWHVREANGWIWIWYHPHDVAPMWDVVEHEEVKDPAWTGYEIAEWTIYGSIQNMAENGVDIAHFKFVHGTADVPTAELRWGEWNRGADVKAKMGTPNGLVDGTISYDTMGPGQSWVRFKGISETLMVASLAPVEEDVLRVRYCFTQPRDQANGPKARLAQALIRDICKQLDQDKVIWDRMRFEPRPVICDSDGPIPQFRQWYARYYAAESPSNAPSREVRTGVSARI